MKEGWLLVQSYQNWLKKESKRDGTHLVVLGKIMGEYNRKIIQLAICIISLSDHWYTKA